MRDFVPAGPSMLHVVAACAVLIVIGFTIIENRRQ